MEHEDDESSRKKEDGRKRKRGEDNRRLCADEAGNRQTEVEIKRRRNIMIVKTKQHSKMGCFRGAIQLISILVITYFCVSVASYYKGGETR